MNPEGKKPTLMLIAGEVSGDMHTAKLAEALQQLCPGIKLFGAGGPLMKAAGVELSVDLTEHAVVGLTEVLAHYPKLRRLFWGLVREAEQRRPDGVVLTDYPGFNLRFAKQMKARGFPVYYYISPQVWAWAQHRANKFSKLVDLMLVIFQFEKDFYTKQTPDLPVEFVGHPVIEQLQKVTRQIEREKNLVALLPGSRGGEIQRNLPAMLAAARLLAVEQPTLRFEMAAASEKSAAIAREMSRGFRLDIRVGNARELMQRATVGVVAAGTATLEGAFFGLPYVIVYRFGWLTYRIFRLVRKVRHLGIVNIIAGREILPEFIQDQAQPERVSAKLSELLRNEPQREQMQRELAEVIASLRGDHAAERAAHAILRRLTLKPNP